MFACWLLFPVVLALLALGSGAVVERLAGVRVAGPLVIPLGLAAMIVLAQAFVAVPSTAHLATPAVTAMALAGLVLTYRGRRERGPVDRAAVALAVGVYAVFLAPVIASGSATFLGYIKLDDTATWLNIVDHVMSHGRDVGRLAGSSGEANLYFYLHTTGYPVGTFLPWGVARAVVGQDAAWVFQPYLSFLAAATALALYEIAGALLDHPWLRAFVAFVAAQSALVVGFAWWGGVKELATAWLMALMAALVPPLLRGPALWRVALVLAVPVAAMVSVLGVGAGPWLAPVLAITAVAAWRLRGRSWTLHQAAALALLAAVLAAAALPPSRDFIKGGGPLYTGGGLFNLFHPLSWFQLFGIWPVRDFRLDPASGLVTALLIALAALGAVLCLVVAWRRRVGAPALYLAATLAGAVAIYTFSSPWIVAKALITTSPAVLFASMLGAALVAVRWRRAVGVALMAAITFGVVWSNVLAFGGVSLAPRDRLADLRANAAPLASHHGPTLVTEPEIYADRHFLPAADAEGVSDFRNRSIPLNDGRKLEKQAYADIDAIQLDAVFEYPTIVMRRSPATSRPPSPYRLVGLSRWYEVWRRPLTPAVDLIDHIPLGDSQTHPYCGSDESGGYSSHCPVQPVAVPDCAHVQRIAHAAAADGATLVAAARPPTVVLDPAKLVLPPGWRIDSASGGVVPGTTRALEATLTVPASASYRVWLGGAFERGFSVAIDGNRIGAARWQLSNLGQYVAIGTARLAAGSHTITLTHASAGAHPGSHDDLEVLGPVALTQATDIGERVISVAPARATALCGRSLDWIEIVRPRTG